jgi:hypothetical protein
MNGKDEIVEEVRAAREAYAARFNYDIRKIYEDIKAREQTSEHPVANLQPVEPHSIPAAPR